MNSQTTASYADRRLADLVQEDERRAEVFEVYGLHFCCDGRQTLRQAAESQGLALDAVLAALTGLGQPDAAHETSRWEDLRVLVRYVCDRHHTYVRSTAPTVEAWLDRVVEHHGARHPELAAVRDVFRTLAADLALHMTKEEQLVFPYIAELEAARQHEASLKPGPFGTILNPVRVMEAEHVRLGALGTQLRALTRGFVAPADGCATYRRCYAEIETFVHDLHRHVHLENNILFPRAIAIERDLM